MNHDSTSAVNDGSDSNAASNSSSTSDVPPESSTTIQPASTHSQNQRQPITHCSSPLVYDANQHTAM